MASTPIRASAPSTTPASPCPPSTSPTRPPARRRVGTAGTFRALGQ
jgi:hypothetical protein